MTLQEQRLQILQEIKTHVEQLMEPLERAIRDNDSLDEGLYLYALEDVTAFCLKQASGSHVPQSVVEWIASSAIGAIDAYPDEEGGKK